MDLFSIDRNAPPPEPVEFRLRSTGTPPAEVTVHVVGEIDIVTEPALIRCLNAQLQPPRQLTSLVVDLSCVPFVGVRGFTALLTAATNAHRRGVAFCLAGCNRPLLRFLALIDTDNTVAVRPTGDHDHAPDRHQRGSARTRHRSEIRRLRWT